MVISLATMLEKLSAQLSETKPKQKSVTLTLNNLMKTTSSHRCQALAALAVLASLSVAHAANISMTADNASGSSSFNSSLSWSDGLAPAAGNDYFNAGFLLRTPGVANGVYTFGGNSLTITGSGLAAAANNQALLFKGTGASGLITVNNLTVNGGQLRNASGDADVFTLAGNSLTVGSSGMNVHVQGPLFVNSAVNGSGEIRILGSGSTSVARVMHLTSGANAFTGNINLMNATQSRFALDAGANLNFVLGASGVNNKVFGSGVAAFNGFFNVDLTGASSLLGDTWTLVDNATLTESFGASFSLAGFADLGGDLWQKSANGADYQFSEATGILSVVAVPEPSSAVLLLGGIAALLRRRRA